MTVYQNSKAGEVKITFVKTHTNHQPWLQEVKYIPLPESIRQEVKKSYADGVKLDYGKQRSKRSEFEERATRSSSITRQDARNIIIRRFENAIKHRHQNDAVSVDRLVKEFQQWEDNPVIAYKPQV